MDVVVDVEGVEVVEVMRARGRTQVKFTAGLGTHVPLSKIGRQLQFAFAAHALGSSTSEVQSDRLPWGGTPCTPSTPNTP